MKICEKLPIFLIGFFWMPTFLNGQNYDSSFVLIVHPRTEIQFIPDRLDPLDVKISTFDLARKMYDELSKCEKIKLISKFDNVMQLVTSFDTLRGNEFIKKTLNVILYKPNGFLFASIEKEINEIIIRAEVLTTSDRSLSAVAKQKISFKDFLANNRFVDFAIKELSEEIAEKITKKACNKHVVGYISLDDYLNMSGRLKYGLGLGLGFKAGNNLTLENISNELRSIQPHINDVRDRPDILTVSNPDNYLIRENNADISLGTSLSFDILQISYWGIVNLSIRTTSINESGLILNQNLYRKWYVTNNINDPDNPSSGTAYIYYSIKSKGRNFFERKSFDLPLFITYPVLYVGRQKEVICKLLGGTNILLPYKIELESEKGWYRFGEYEIQNEGKRSLGDLKEIEWFAGIDIDASISRTLKLGLEFAEVYTDYKGDFNVPLSFKQQKNFTTSLRIDVVWQF
jgi:hypothetical protein